MLSARSAGLPLDIDRGISTKTPGHVLNKTRNVLQENTIRNVPTTAIGKGRKVIQNTPLQSKTLQVDRMLKDLPGKQLGPSKPKDTPAIRPLGDKTPFPNHTANNSLFVTGAKIAKPSLSDRSLRPSSARTHDRLPRSASKAFETPVTDGKHWDVSDIEIKIDTPVANQSIEEESYDEVEYMPPKTEDILYEPLFEMPNYREVGKTLMALIRSYTLEDDPPSANITFTAESDFFAPPTIPQREIEEDNPFARPKPGPEVKPQSLATPKQKVAITSKPAPRPAAQRGTPGTRTLTPANPRVLPTIRRPATTSTARPPPVTVARTSSSQPTTRAPTSQSTLRAPTSRSTTRAPSGARSTPPVRAGAVAFSSVIPVSRPVRKPAAQPTVPTALPKGKRVTTQPSVAPAAGNPVPPSIGRPRSGTITKEAFESNTHVVVHIGNNSLEDVKKDLEGLIVLEDAFDEGDGFRFDV